MAQQSPYYGLKTLNDAYNESESFGNEITSRFRRLMASGASREEIYQEARRIGYSPLIDYGNGQVKDTTDFLAQNAPRSFAEGTQDAVLGTVRGVGDGFLSVADLGASLWRFAGTDAPMKMVGSVREGLHAFTPMSNEYRAGKQSEGIFDLNPAAIGQGVGSVVSMYGPGGIAKGLAAGGSKVAARYLVKEAARQAAGKMSLAVKTGVAMGAGGAARQAYEEGATPAQSILPTIAGAAGGYLEKYGTERVIAKMLSPGVKMAKDAAGRLVFPKASTLPGFLKTTTSSLVGETLEEQAASALLEIGRSTYAKDPFLQRLKQGQIDTLASAPYAIMPFALYGGAKASNFKQQLSAAERIVRERKASVFNPDGFDGSSLEREYVDLSALTAEDLANLSVVGSEVAQIESDGGSTTTAPVYTVTSASHEPMQALAEQLTNATGARVVFFGQTPESKEARKAAKITEPVAPSVLGKYDAATNTIYINTDAAPEAQMVFGAMHEVTHMLRKADPKGIDGVFERISQAFGEEFVDYSKRVSAAYKGAPQDVITEEGYVNFMTQHLFGYMMAAITDEQSMRQMMLADPSLGQVIAAPFFEIADTLSLKKGAAQYDRAAADRLAGAALRFAQSAGVGVMEGQTQQYTPQETDVTRNMTYASDFVEALQSFLGDKGQKMEALRRVLGAIKTENESVGQVEMMASAAERMGMTIPEVEAMYNELQAAEAKYPVTSQIVKSVNEAVAKARASVKPTATPEEIAAAETEAKAAAEEEAQKNADAETQRKLVVEALAVANEAASILGVEPVQLLRLPKSGKNGIGSLSALSDAQRDALMVARDVWDKSEPQYREGAELAAAEARAAAIKAFDRTKLDENIRLKNRTPLEVLQESEKKSKEAEAAKAAEKAAKDAAKAAEKAAKDAEKAKPKEAKPAAAKPAKAPKAGKVDPAATPVVRPQDAAPAETTKAPVTEEDLKKSAALRSQASFASDLAGKTALELQQFVDNFPEELAELVGKPYAEQVAILQAEANRLTAEARAIDGQFARFVPFGSPRSSYKPSAGAEAIKPQMDVINGDFDNPVSRDERSPLPRANGDTGPKAIAKFFRKLMPASQVLDYKDVMPKKANGDVNTATADWNSKPVQRMVDRMSTRIYDVSRAALHEYPALINWYKDRVEMAMKIAEEMDPDFAKSENQFRFKVALAIMSNGERVNANAAYAWAIYQAWKVNPEAGMAVAFKNAVSKAKRQGAMEAHFTAIDMMVNKVGWSGVQSFMARTGTREQLINDMASEFGISKSVASKMTNGELVDEVVPYSLFLGPKLGSFYGNLDGRYDTTTMDLWFMRTMGRIFGTQLRTVDIKQLATRMEQAEAGLDPQTLADVKAKAGVRQGASVQTRSMLYAKLFQDTAERAMFEAKNGAPEQNEEFRTAANALSKSVDGKVLVEAPENGAHRRMIRLAMNKVVARLKEEDGITITPAELQAVLWYYEKEVHEEYGSGTRDAPDYATAMKTLWDYYHKPKLDDYRLTLEAHKTEYRRTKQRAQAEPQLVTGAGQQARNEQAEKDRVTSLASALSSPKAYRGGRIESRRSIERFGDAARIDGQIEQESKQPFDEALRSSQEQQATGQPTEFNYFARKVPISDRVSQKVADKFEDTITKLDVAGRTTGPLLATYDAVTEIMARYGGGVAERLGVAIANLQRFELVGQQVTSPLELAALAQIYRDPRFESARWFFTDDNGNILSQATFSIGAPSQTYIAPPHAEDWVREAFKDAFNLGATGFYMMHNHPSTNMSPSKPDIISTGQISEMAQRVGMKMHGHVVLDSDQFIFIDAKALLDASLARNLMPSEYGSIASDSTLIADNIYSVQDLPFESASYDEAFGTFEDVKLPGDVTVPASDISMGALPGALRAFKPYNNPKDPQLSRASALQAFKWEDLKLDSGRAGYMAGLAGKVMSHIKDTNQIVLIAQGAGMRVTSISSVSDIDVLTMTEKELQEFLINRMRMGNGSMMVAVGANPGQYAALNRLYSYCVDCVIPKDNGDPESYNLTHLDFKYSTSGSAAGIAEKIAKNMKSSAYMLPNAFYAAARSLHTATIGMSGNYTTFGPLRTYSDLSTRTRIGGRPYYELLQSNTVDQGRELSREPASTFPARVYPMTFSQTPGAMQSLTQAMVDRYNASLKAPSPDYFAKRVPASGGSIADARLAIDAGKGYDYFAKRVSIEGRSVRGVNPLDNAAYRTYWEEGQYAKARLLKDAVAAKLGLHKAYHGTHVAGGFTKFDTSKRGLTTGAKSAQEAFFAVKDIEVARGYQLLKYTSEDELIAKDQVNDLNGSIDVIGTMLAELDEMAMYGMHILPLSSTLGQSYGAPKSARFAIVAPIDKSAEGFNRNAVYAELSFLTNGRVYDSTAAVDDVAFADLLVKMNKPRLEVGLDRYWSGDFVILDYADTEKRAKYLTDGIMEVINNRIEEMRVEVENIQDNYVGGYDEMNLPGAMLDLWLKISNPLIVDGKSEAYQEGKFAKNVELAKERGHDGVIFTNVDDSVDRSGQLSTVYAFFKPQQAKFADVFELDDAGNLIDLDKQFDFRKGDMRWAKRVPFFSSGMDATKPLDFSSIDRQSAGWFVKHFVDYVQPIRVVAKSIEEAAKASGGAMAAWSERFDVSARLDLYRNLASEYAKTGEAFVDDTSKAMADGKIPLTRQEGDAAGNGNISVQEYLIAKHAKRRNEVMLDDTLAADTMYRREMDAGNAAGMASRRAAMLAADPGLAALSGMTDTEAARILAAARHPAYSKLSQAAQALQARKLQLGVQSGLLSAAQAQAWKDKFGPDYVPLKTTLLDPNESYLGGSGFSISGMESKKAIGRRTLADDVAGHMLVDYGAFVSRATKNWVGQAFFRLAEAYPNAAWTLYPDRASVPVQDQNRIFTSKFDGEEMFMVVNNAEMVRALKNMDMADMGRGMAVASMLSRMFTKLQTAWSPAFILPNFSRDLGLALTLTAVDESAAVAAKVAGNIPAALTTIFNEQFGRAPGKLDAYYREMQQTGGLTGYATYWDVHDAAAQLSRQAARLSGQTSMPVEFLRGTASLMEKLNAVAERATRLAVYAEARDRGLSRLKAGEVAVNITVNFGRRGNATPVMNTLYPFFNASIQGTDNLARRMYWSERATEKQKKRMAAALGSLSVMGYLFSMVARAAGGDDDDGEVAYRNIPEYDLSRNIVIMTPDGKGNRFLVPLPWGLSAAFYAGVQLERTIAGDETARESGGRVLRNTIENLSPINGATWSQAIAPTLVDPIVQIAENTNFAGAKIMPDRNPHDRTPLPDSQLKFKTVNPVAAWLSETMNELTGGSRRKEGAIDVSPETWEHLAKFMAGGAGNFVYGVFTGIAKPFSGEDVTFEQLPVVGSVAGRFYTEEDPDRRTTTEFYDNMQKFAVLREDLEDPETVREARRSRLNVLDAYTTEVDAKVRQLRKDMRAARNQIQAARIEKEMITMMRQYNRRYNAIARRASK